MDLIPAFWQLGTLPFEVSSLLIEHHLCAANLTLSAYILVQAFRESQVAVFVLEVVTGDLSDGSYKLGTCTACSRLSGNFSPGGRKTETPAHARSFAQHPEMVSAAMDTVELEASFTFVSGSGKAASAWSIRI